VEAHIYVSDVNYGTQGSYGGSSLEVHNGAKEAHSEALEGLYSLGQWLNFRGNFDEDPDLDPHHIERSDPDPHQTRIRICIKVKNRIRIRIKLKSRILKRIRIKVVRMINNASHTRNYLYCEGLKEPAHTTVRLQLILFSKITGAFLFRTPTTQIDCLTGAIISETHIKIYI
jgi:hypothetical protein